MQVFKVEEDLKVANKKLKEITNKYQILKKFCNIINSIIKYNK